MQGWFRLAKLLVSWPWVYIVLILLGLLLAGMPEQLEGPILITLDDEGAHGITVSNVIALPFLLYGAWGLLSGAWRNSALLHIGWQRHSVLISALCLQLGLGVILLLRSGVSTALVWWGPGVLVSILALVGLAFVVTAGEAS
jgi:hypothetical protein